jgi:predicted CoA-binding protein
MKSNAEKTTLVLGASDNPERTSYTALHMLTEAGVPVLAVGLKEAEVAGVQIRKGTDWLAGVQIHTVTLYMNALRQKELQAFILQLNPKRIIFNPGAENPDLQLAASLQGIECRNACTLVMLNFGQF